MQGKDLVKPKYTGISQAIRLVLLEEGLLAMWKGNGANVLRVVPVYGLKFAFNDSIKAIVAGPSKRRLDMSDLLWVGTLAGLIQTALTYPLETVRTRLTLGPEQGVQYKGISDCFRQILRTEGISGLCVQGGQQALSRAARHGHPSFAHTHPPPHTHHNTQVQGLWSHHALWRALHWHSDDQL